MKKLPVVLWTLFTTNQNVTAEDSGAEETPTILNLPGSQLRVDAYVCTSNIIGCQEDEDLDLSTSTQTHPRPKKSWLLDLKIGLTFFHVRIDFEYFEYLSILNSIWVFWIFPWW